MFNFLIAILIFTQTFRTIEVDGALSDWTQDELVIPDSPIDCAVTGNEIYGIYMTWDTTYLYVGASYKLQNKALLIVLDRGTGKGVHDINNLDWYPRNFQFFGMNADILIALWNADLGTGGVREITGEVVNNTVKTRPFPGVMINNSATPGDSGGIEVAIPFSQLYPGGFPAGASIKAVALIAGSDHEGGVESAPDNPWIRPFQASSVRKITHIVLDSNNDSQPDEGVYPREIAEIIYTEEKTLKISKFELSQRAAKTGENIDIIVSVTDYTNLDVAVYNERGELIKRFSSPNAIPNEEYTFNWDLTDLTGITVKQGIYIIVVKAGEYVREKKAVLVYK
ncbi:MAG: hypothetical protein QMD82_07210 [bacterium]|nr:hypothetical protein [bacterium]